MSMRKIREVFRLKHERGLGNRQIAASLKISHSTVGKYVRRASEPGLEWPLEDGLDDAPPQALLFPPSGAPRTAPGLGARAS